MCEDFCVSHITVNMSKPASLLRLNYLSRVDFNLEKCMLTLLSLPSLGTFIISTQPFRRVVEQVSGCFCLLELSHRKSSRCCFPWLIHQETLEKPSRGAVKAGRGAEEHEGNTVSASRLASVCRLVLRPQRGGRKQLTGLLWISGVQYRLRPHVSLLPLRNSSFKNSIFLQQFSWMHQSRDYLPFSLSSRTSPPPHHPSAPPQSETVWEQQSVSHTSGADEAAHTCYWALLSSGGVPQGSAGGCSSLFVSLLQ